MQFFPPLFPIYKFLFQFSGYNYCPDIIFFLHFFRLTIFLPQFSRRPRLVFFYSNFQAIMFLFINIFSSELFYPNFSDTIFSMMYFFHQCLWFTKPQGFPRCCENGSGATFEEPRQTTVPAQNLLNFRCDSSSHAS